MDRQNRIMKKLPQKITQKLQQREQSNALRKMSFLNNLIDFASNDYLGFAQNEAIFDQTHNYLVENKLKVNGATGSRLLSGNHLLYPITEEVIARFHQSEDALIFNSGYDANVGFFGAVPQRNDVVFYDELCHASIRDGIQLGNAKAYKFSHNDVEELERSIEKINSSLHPPTIYIVTESVFSMDGDTPNLDELVLISEKHNCYLVIDEAHAIGVYGENGAGLVQLMGLQDRIFARIVTFGKALGCHGAAILGSLELKKYLINFSRSFIYTTGLSPHSVATILFAYHQLQAEKNAIEKLKGNIQIFNQQKLQLGLKPMFVYSKSAIQCAIIPGNEKVKNIASQIQQAGFDVKPILSPTVPEGQERLRFCLHSFNSEKEITDVLQLLATFVF